MADPITAGAIATIMLSKFAEAGASEAAKKLIENLWGAVAARFQGRKKAEAAIAQLEASQGKAPEAEANLVRVLDAEMFEDDAFAGQVQQMAQQIIQMQNQSQTQKTVTMNQANQDQAKGYQVEADRIEHLGDRY
ncbi:MAG: hypothetical protein HC824_13395 [Synechococcales cyanobacterium RM1_1_8]|nr:hypothetical protein [Synechococcales cyanobacterium RM1_1_8]